jgi:hypothetical protein
VQPSARWIRRRPDAAWVTCEQFLHQPHATNAGNPLQPEIQPRGLVTSLGLVLGLLHFRSQPRKVVLLKRPTAHRSHRDALLEIVELAESLIGNQLRHIFAAPATKAVFNRLGGKLRATMFATRHVRLSVASGIGRSKSKSTADPAIYAAILTMLSRPSPAPVSQASRYRRRSCGCLARSSRWPWHPR